MILIAIHQDNGLSMDSCAKHSTGWEMSSSSTDANKNDIGDNNGDDVTQVFDQAITDPQGHEGIYTGDILTSTLLPHGKGCMQYTLLDRSYDGEWIHRQRQGTGYATSPNGDSYDGSYAYDKRKGHGREYRGEYVNDKRHGKGKMWWPDGTVYQGDFFEGFRDGNGLHDFTNGDRYEERVVKNKFDGEGSFTGQMANLTTGDYGNYIDMLTPDTMRSICITFGYSVPRPP